MLKHIPKRLMQVGFILVIIGVVVLAFVHIRPININQTFTAQRANMLTPDVFDDVTILISGTYRINIFGNDSFEGTIEIEGYRITERSQVSILIDRSSPVALTYRNTQTWITSVFGEFRASRLFRDFDIIVYNRFEENEFAQGYINLQNDNNVFIAYSRRWRNNDSLLSRYSAFMDMLRESMSQEGVEP